MSLPCTPSYDLGTGEAVKQTNTVTETEPKSSAYEQSIYLGDTSYSDTGKWLGKTLDGYCNCSRMKGPPGGFSLEVMEFSLVLQWQSHHVMTVTSHAQPTKCHASCTSSGYSKPRWGFITFFFSFLPAILPKWFPSFDCPKLWVSLASSASKAAAWVDQI